MTELTCYNHPNRPTLLRCNQCERPICTSCAIRTPTGYRCTECVRGQQRVFDTAQWSDYVIAFFTGAILSGIASLLVLAVTSFIWFLAIPLAPLAGVTIANIARRFVKGRHSRWLNLLFGASIIIGALPTILVLGVGGGFLMFATAESGGNFLSNIFALGPLLWQIVYLVMAVPTAYSQFSGLFFRR
ncbi:MAG: B-box zinc finger protein [Chloroflexota bacterium]